MTMSTGWMARTSRPASPPATWPTSTAAIPRKRLLICDGPKHASGVRQEQRSKSLVTGLQEAVDSLIKLHDADPHADIEAIWAKVGGCAEPYEVHDAGVGGYGIAAARRRLADAFAEVRAPPLSLDMSEEIKNPTR